MSPDRRDPAGKLEENTVPPRQHFCPESVFYVVSLTTQDHLQKENNVVHPHRGVLSNDSGRKLQQEVKATSPLNQVLLRVFWQMMESSPWWGRGGGKWSRLRGLFSKLIVSEGDCQKASRWPKSNWEEGPGRILKLGTKAVIFRHPRSVWSRSAGIKALSCADLENCFISPLDTNWLSSYYFAMHLSWTGDNMIVVGLEC